MAVAFLDTSALLKLYVDEQGSIWLRNFVIGQQVSISELALFEAVNALRRRYTQGDLTRAEAIDLFGQLNRSSVSYGVVTLGGQVQLNRLLNLIFNMPVALQIRSLDSIHLTAAQIALEDAMSQTPSQPFIFVSSDAQLLRVAQAQGFTVENPENYP